MSCYQNSTPNYSKKGLKKKTYPKVAKNPPDQNQKKACGKHAGYLTVKVASFGRKIDRRCNQQNKNRVEQVMQNRCKPP